MRRVTFSMEVEFFMPYQRSVYSSLLSDLGFHRDYFYTYEVSLRPYDLNDWKAFRKEYLAVKREIERVGGILCAEYSNRRDDWTNGSHIHIRIEPEDPVLWARALNWTSIMAALLAPLQAMCRRVYHIRINGTDYYLMHEYCTENNYMFRFKVSHFAEPPLRVSWKTMESLLRLRRFRSIVPIEGANHFYGVEINKYRKSVATIEIRTNENGWKTAVAFADIINFLVDFNTPKKLKITNLWRVYIKGDLPIRVDAEMQMDDDHPILPRRLSPVIVAGTLLDKMNEYGYKPKAPTKQLLEILASGRRPVFEETI